MGRLVTSKIRIEYSWLAEEARFLVSTFGFEMSAQSWRDHDRLMDGCESLDRIVDGAPDDVRADLADDVIGALRQGRPDGFQLEQELTRQVWILADIFARYSTPSFFIDRAERIFQIAEEIRITDCLDAYVALVCEEGRCFLEMFLPIFEVHATDEFLHFFPEVAEVGNLVDKLVDARADFRRGEMRLNPGVGHHARLLREIAWRGREAFVRFPRRAKLFTWAIRFFDPRRHVSAWR